MDINEKINLAQAAALLGVTPKTVSVLCSQGYIDRDKNGFVTPARATQGYVLSIKKAGGRADAEYKQVKTMELKNRVAARDGKYQQRANEEAYQLSMEAWTQVSNYLNSLPAMITRDPAERKRITAMNTAFQHKFVAFVNTELRHST